MDLQQPPVFLDRSTRGTRGKRMTKLLDDELEEDEVFWNQDALKEEDNDVEYEEEAEVADVYDSDFDDDEPEADEEMENEPDERTRTKKKLIFPGKPPTKKKKNKALSMIEKVPEDEKISEQFTPDEHHELHDDAEEEKIVRKSTRTSVIIRQAERDAIRAALQATTKPIKKKKEGEEKRMTQEEMLLEAAQTEIMNLRNLERVLAREEEVKKRAIVHKQVYSGPKIQYLSKDGSSYLNFTGGSSFQSEISTTPIPYPEKAFCVITGLPAMGFFTPEENVSSQNSQIPPNHQYSPFVSSLQYPPQFPNFPLVPNFQGFGNFFNHPINVPRAPYQITTPDYWQNMNNSSFKSSYFFGLSNPQATGTPMEKESTTPTSVPETQVTEGDSPIELANFEKADSGAEVKRKRSAWGKVEDEVLAKSFVSISDDRIIGNDQKTDAFWGRVASYYNEHRPTGSPNRSASVIRPHWHNTIHKKVYRFNAHYNSVYSAYRNGYSDEKILLLAYEKYRKENNGTAFNLEHVWRIVKDSPMFTPQSSDHIIGAKKVRTSESGASNTSSNQDASVGIDLAKKDTRPIGHKTSKRKGKYEANSAMESMIEKWDNMFAKFTEYTSMKNVEFSMKQKQLEVEEIKAKTALAKVQLKEYAILSKDTSQMTKEQLTLHERFCQEIRGRWNM